jgi:alpha-galactosidase
MCRGFAGNLCVALFLAAITLGGVAMSAASDVFEPGEVDFNRQWAERAFAAVPESGGNRLTVAHDDEPGTAKVNRCAAGTPLRLGEKTYDRGIGVNSNCTLRVTLEKPAARLLADIGIDRNVDGSVASAAFQVSVEGREVFATEVMRPTGEVVPIDVALNGATSFDLSVSDGGDGRGWDQADWADARVVLDDGTELWLDDLAKASGVDSPLPFSFVYGGRHSSTFIAEWRAEVTEERVDETKDRRTLALTDPDTGLEVQAVCIIYADCPGVDWTLHFTNTGSEDTPVIEQVMAADVSTWLGPGVAPVFQSLRSTSGVDDWQPFDQPLPNGHRHTFTPIRGRSSCGACPFFTVDWGNAGVVTAIGWTGQWTASIEHINGAMRIQAGMKNLRLKLHPGESIRSPRILQLYWRGDDPDRAHNLFRQTMLRQIVPRVDGECVTPPIAHLSTAFYEFDDGTEADVLAHLKAAEGLGFEYFWLDAYYGIDRFPTVGNYVLPLERGVDLKRFPKGIRPISDAAHKAGMKFLLWVEPERICPGTLMAKEHPEWVVLPENGHWGMFDLGLPEAREYLTDYLLTAIREYKIDCLRIDNATEFDVMWGILDGDDSDRVGMSEIRYVEGLYRVWDDILAANPHLFIDNVSSGGHRIDLELCSRAIPLWRTDATIHPLLQKDYLQAALQNQVMTAGLSRYVPYNVSGQSGATPYLFRSGFNAGISFCEDVRPPDYPRDLLAQAIAEGKRIRKYFSGDLHPLSDVTTSPKDWLITQYHRPEHGDGMVLAFRRQASPYTAIGLNGLRAIDPEATYEVTESRTYEPSAPVTMKGADLLRYEAHIAECPGSIVIEYREM